AADDTLFFAEESLRLQSTDDAGTPQVVKSWSGHKESRLPLLAAHAPAAFSVLHGIFANGRAYHFHDTSAQAQIRLHGYIEDNKFLKSDAGNLAAILYKL